MKRFQFILSLIGFFFQVESRISAQENIIISDSLAANAEILELVVESLERKMFKFSIGDYAVMADHKMKRTYRDNKAKIPGILSSGIDSIISPGDHVHTEICEFYRLDIFQRR